MKTPCLFLGFLFAAFGVVAGSGPETALEAGLAVRDITPEPPIRLAGYAARKRPADKVDLPLRARAMALRNPSGERFVFVALDNCEVSHAFMQPVLQQLKDSRHLEPGTVAVISSHTHSAPVLTDTMPGMPLPPLEDEKAIAAYSAFLRAKLVEVVGAALDDLKPAWLEFGMGRATFAMNRRIFADGKVDFGENFDGPVDWDVPVLRVTASNGVVRAVLFGYACHGTSIENDDDDWYAVSGDYMGYACQLLESYQPGAAALYLTGFGGDSNPSPRARLLDAKRHGLEMAGAVLGVLDRPMRQVRGPFKLAYEDVAMPLADPPTREQLKKDSLSQDVSMKQRAERYLKWLDVGQALPRSVTLPVAALRLDDDLTFVLMGGEVVVDYSRRLKRLLASDHPWMVGYAYEVPCYIPSARLLKEGGYETDYSLVYYGFYGPLQSGIEDLLVNHATTLVAGLRGR